MPYTHSRLILWATSNYVTFRGLLTRAADLQLRNKSADEAYKEQKEEKTMTAFEQLQAAAPGIVFTQVEGSECEVDVMVASGHNIYRRAPQFDWVIAPGTYETFYREFHSVEALVNSFPEIFVSATVATLQKQAADADLSARTAQSVIVALNEKVAMLEAEPVECAQALVKSTDKLHELESQLEDAQDEVESLLSENTDLMEALDVRDEMIADATTARNSDITEQCALLVSENSGLKQELEDAEDLIIVRTVEVDQLKKKAKSNTRPCNPAQLVQNVVTKEGPYVVLDRERIDGMVSIYRDERPWLHRKLGGKKALMDCVLVYVEALEPYEAPEPKEPFAWGDFIGAGLMAVLFGLIALTGLMAMYPQMLTSLLR